MQHIVILNGDGHGSLPSREYRQYLEQRYIDVFQTWLHSRPSVNEEHDRFSKEADDFRIRAQFSNAQQANRRLETMLADGGVLGEVLFPDFMGGNEIPFTGGGIGLTNDQTWNYELRWAGLQAHNRWQADFCVANRQVGLAGILYDDVDKAVREVEWAARAGLKGVLLSQGVDDNFPALGSDHFEPLWTALEECEMPITFHGGAGLKNDLMKAGPSGYFILGHETTFFAKRPLWHLIWSGVFERHPRLRAVWAETGVGWVLRTLRQMDQMFDHMDSNPYFESGSNFSLKPSEYWKRQCFVVGSQMSTDEYSVCKDLGLETVIFGTDFPHPDSTWGHTLAYIQATLGRSSLSASDARQVLGENMARCYRLDMGPLHALAAAHGPQIDQVFLEAPILPEVLRWRAARSSEEDLYLYTRGLRGSLAIA